MIWFALAGLVIAAVGAIGLALAANARRKYHAHVESLRANLENTLRAAVARPDLPAEVTALARRLGVSSNDRSRLVRLTQSGDMWLKPGTKPLAFKAQQIITIAEPGFLWQARFSLAGLPLQIIDGLIGGEGRLEGRLFGVLQMLDMRGGDAMFRGEAMRYLGELMWNPDALLLNQQLDWRVIDARTIAVATGQAARRCEVRLILNELGDPVRIDASDRPRAVGNTLVPCPWFGRCSDWQTIGGRRIPMKAEAGWRLDGVEFVYWRGRIESWFLQD